LRAKEAAARNKYFRSSWKFYPYLSIDGPEQCLSGAFMKYLQLAIIPCILALSACGETPKDRAASGALVGAGAGAAVGAVVAGNPWAGAAVGGAVGAGAGAAVGSMTSPSQVDLGKPVWR
jgi:osmotically inducible lipoprotein OsmB